MVLAYHLVWTAYGWWLPNDPRGSMSHEIRNDVLRELGEIHYGRKKLQPASRDIRAFYERAKELLQHALLTFTIEELAAVADAFAGVISTNRYTCYAAAVMPDHVHLVIRKHRDQAEDMISRSHAASREAIRLLGQRQPDHPVWGGPGWKVFLDSPDDITRTIHYVRDNPLKAGRAAQSWDFVAPYDGWPFHRRRVRD